MEEIIKIGEKEIGMKANGNTPRLYREIFGRDLMVEWSKFLKHIDKKSGSLIGDFDFSTIENLAFIMAKQYDPSLTNINEWLEQFGIDDIYLSMAQIVGLWEKSKKTTSEPKKNINK